MSIFSSDSDTKKPRLKAGPVKPGQPLINKPQLLELCGDPSYSTVWGWMRHADFPLPLELGPPGGRSSRVVWVVAEVLAWLESRPRRAIGHLKGHRAAQESTKVEKPAAKITRDAGSALAAAMAASPAPKAKVKPELEPAPAVAKKFTGVRTRHSKRVAP